jgi:hypothetical protein
MQLHLTQSELHNNPLIISKMKQETVQKLLSMLTNYAEHMTEVDPKDALDRVRHLLLMANNHAFKPISNMEEAEMVANTVMCLNDASEEAMEEAFMIKVQAVASGDEELIKKIEYLWDVI